jgi:hypothetical protein
VGRFQSTQTNAASSENEQISYAELSGLLVLLATVGQRGAEAVKHEVQPPTRIEMRGKVTIFL